METLGPSALIDAIKAQGSIEVAISSAPPNIVKAPDGSWQGVFPDIVKYIGDQLDVRVNFTEVAFSAMIAGIQAERYDFALVQAITPERQQAVNFTDPVSFNVGVFYVDKTKNSATSYDDLNRPDQTICTAGGTIYDNQLTSMNPQAQVLRLTSWNDCLTAMQAGRASTMLFGWNEVTTLAPTRPEFGIVFPTEAIGLSPLAFVIQKKYTQSDIDPINQLIANWTEDPSRVRASLQKVGANDTPLAYAVGTIPQYAKDAVAKSIFGTL